ncbi:MAG: protease inhibitor I42 family protein [Pseudomonadota bacterium]
MTANPTAGCRWTADYDKDGVSLKSKTYVRERSKPKGRWGGHAVFEVVPVRTGGTRIRLACRRSGEARSQGKQRVRRGYPGVGSAPGTARPHTGTVKP